TSHGATVPIALLGVAVDWLHVLAAAVWVGGLLALAAIAPLVLGHGDVLTSITRRFTRMAVLAVVVIIASGTVQTVLEVGSWEGLISTGYGLGVLAKIALLAGMLALAWLNRRQRRVPLFARGVRAEVALGVVVLAVAAVVAGTTP